MDAIVWWWEGMTLYQRGGVALFVLMVAMVVGAVIGAWQDIRERRKQRDTEARKAYYPPRLVYTDTRPPGRRRRPGC